MANIVLGKVLMIGAKEALQSKDGTKTFYKRELVVDATRFDGLTGERGFDNFPSFEFSGDNCDMLDEFKIGDVVKVSFDLQGIKYEKDGAAHFFTKVRGYKVEPHGKNAHISRVLSDEIQDTNDGQHQQDKVLPF